jgi:hypothetical protein
MLKPLHLQILLLLLCACLVGCGDNGGRVPVTGTVSFNGQPLETGHISFGGDQGAAGVGQIVQGEFSLSETANQDGVLPGKYDVLIHSWVEERGSVRADGSFSPGITRIPLKYLDPAKSGLTAEVTPDGPNRFTFELESDGTENKPDNASRVPR